MALRKKLRSAGENLREQAELLLPTDRVELLSNRQAVVDGCRGILEYDDTVVRLTTGRLVLAFRGEGLTLRSYGETGAVVEGDIRRVEFL